jgi:hypothetical protein
MYGARVVVETESAFLAAAADELLSPFRSVATASDEPLRLVLEAVTESNRVPPDLLRVSDRLTKLPNDPTLTYSVFEDVGRWIVEFESGIVISLDLRQSEVTAWIAEPHTYAPDVVPSLVRFAVIELLRLRGIFAVHAAVLSRGDTCVAIVGPSGRGKTTSAVSLMRAGYRCLSDDSPLLREDETGFRFLPFPSRVSVTDRTISWFEELRSLAETFRVDSRKRSADVEAIFGAVPASAARPVALIFPIIVDEPQSRIVAMPAARALEELLPEALFLLDRAMASAQFGMLSRLVTSTPCYRLFFGADVQNLPTIVDPLLAGKGTLPSTNPS